MSEREKLIGAVASWLSLLVHRRGGYMKIENVSDLDGQDLNLVFNLDEEHDFVELEVTPKATRKGNDHGSVQQR